MFLLRSPTYYHLKIPILSRYIIFKWVIILSQSAGMLHSGPRFDPRQAKNFKISSGNVIKRNGEAAEPQSLVSASKYSWIKSQTPPQCNYSEGKFTVDSDYLSIEWRS